MKLKFIRSKKDYLKALERFETIFQSRTGSKSDEADVLALLIKEYEDKYYIIQGAQIGNINI